MKRGVLTVWDEARQQTPEIAAVYPHGIGAFLASLFEGDGWNAQKVALDDPAQGLPPEVLDETDVLVWWAHIANREVSDELVLRIQKRVLEGMGFIVLHSAAWAKPFVRLMGTTCQFNYRMAFEREHLWVVNPGHPIVEGIGAGFVIEEEVYTEHFDVPVPDELVFISGFDGGEVFRSGCCWKRGAGRIFYFRPGHETLPTYHHPTVQRVLLNAARWARPSGTMRFQSGPIERDSLNSQNNQGNDGHEVIGQSHALLEVLDEQKYLR